MPKKGQTRDLPQDLRKVLADNLNDLMGKHQLNNIQVETASGVGRNTVKRVRRQMVAANLDTVQALADAFKTEAWLLLMKGGVGSVGKVFTTPVKDARLGNAWTRPDRKPLLQSGTAKSSTRQTKIKIK
jgi:hypothetical protein